MPPSSEYGWREEAGGFSPEKTTMNPAPELILHLVKCDCTFKNKVHNTKMRVQKQQSVLY